MSNPQQPDTIADLLDPDSWSRLSQPVRDRFSRRFRPGATTCYRGRVSHTRLSRCGWLLAQFARLIGAPLPLREDTGLATVIVTDHPETSGQVWSRLYHSRADVPQVIQSVKRLTGPTGLEELLGYGLSIALTLSVEAGALVFTGRSYYWRAGRLRLRLPQWLSPGTLIVRNWQNNDREFHFSLALIHPWLGSLIEQEACFDAAASSSTELNPRLENAADWPQTDSRSAHLSHPFPADLESRSV